MAVHWIDVALAEPVNAGITALALRPVPLEAGRYEAFVQMHGKVPEEREANMEIRLDRRLISVRKVPIRSNGRERLLLPVEGGMGAVLSLHVKLAGDCLPADDAVYVRIPADDPIRVLWVADGADPFTQLALQSLTTGGEVEVFRTEPEAWPPSESFDVVLFDGWLPEAWERDVATVVLDPPGACGPVHAVRLQEGGVPVTDLRAVDEGHPLLYGVASSRVALTQTAVLAAEGPLQPLWMSASGPLLLAGEVAGQRVAIMAFAPERSERLPLMASFPLLIGNAVYWAARPAIEAQSANNRRTGDVVELCGKTLHWRVPGPVRDAHHQVALTGRWTALDRIGLWETDAGQKGSAALLSVRETRLPAREAQARDAGGQAAAAGLLLGGGDLRAALLWSLLVLLLVESYLFHRHAVY